MSAARTDRPNDPRVVPALPPMRQRESPQVVLALDEIRRALDRTEDADRFAEFTWFAREYPRCYRFHLDGADHRLRTIHSCMASLHSSLARRPIESPAVWISDHTVQRVYWDFESYLSEVCIALDLLARIAGTAFRQHTAPSFRRFCKKADDSRLAQLFVRARDRWVSRLKDYRDCFIHYTPVDTMLTVSLTKHADGWELRAKLPVNPNAREIDSFRYSRRVELLRYAIAVHRHVTAFDRAVAAELRRLFRRDEYPTRITSLFSIGERTSS